VFVMAFTAPSLFDTRTSDSCMNKEALVLKSFPSSDRKFALNTKKHFF
jgi:hypothetical protein